MAAGIIIVKIKWEFPLNAGSHFGVLFMRDPSILGPYEATLFLETPIWAVRRPVLGIT